MNAGIEDNTKRLLPAVFLISAAVIGWQLALMRCLLISEISSLFFPCHQLCSPWFWCGRSAACSSEKMVRTPLSFDISMGDIVIRHFIANLFLAGRTISS